jgi:DNA polymerase bacteriophage-type
VSVDASQIEARISGWFCGQEDLTELWRSGADVYSTFASKVYGYEVSKKDHPTERFLGKTSILGLQYGLGAPKFQKTVRIQSDGQVVIDELEALRIVSVYRQTYGEISGSWQKLNLLIGAMTKPDCHIEWGPVVFQFESILLPNGMRLYYHELAREGNEWKFTYMGKRKKIYGAKVLENIVQALARIATFEAAARVRKRLDRLGLRGLDLAGQVHDELIYVPPVDLAKIVKATVLEEMAVSPSWGPDLPLTAEAKLGPSYGDLKPG